MSESLSHAARALMLPLSQAVHPEVVDALVAFGGTRDLEPDDLSILLLEQLAAWAKDGVVGELLREAIDVALFFTPEILDDLAARSYLRMYAKLRTRSGDLAGLTHTVARDLLSRTSLICHLLSEQRLSCSQIARLLSSTDTDLDVSYGSVVVIARELRLLPELPRGPEYLALWERDRSLSLHLFPDSSIDESNEIATATLSAWMSDRSIRDHLVNLNPPAGDAANPPWPYLQILHWCLTPLEYFDHPASYLYEFKPRGYAGESLFANYPAVTGNPVLNNAKAVETLNQTWSRNRGGEDAHSLVGLLQSLEALPAVPRQEAARVLRAWLWRVIELRTVLPRHVTCAPSAKVAQTVVKFISQHETSTQGVIEQRVVDYLGYLAHAVPGWRQRGLGDGVNASNYSRHKLGDIEFTNVDERSAIAIEAHGGHLSETYVNHHRRSLARIVEQRLAESWANLDEPSRWSIRVIFVAHSHAAALPTAEILHGVPVTYEYIDYVELASRADAMSSEADRRDAFQIYVIDALNRETVRESVRDKFREISRGESMAH